MAFKKPHLEISFHYIPAPEHCIFKILVNTAIFKGILGGLEEEFEIMMHLSQDIN